MRYFWILFFGILLSTSCKSEYEQMVEREKGIQQDSLFLGITFGMTSKEFYAHCWELNKQELIKQGPVNQTVEYNLDDELRQEGHMYFYPKFQDDKIHEMPVTFSYDALPWTDEYSLDTLYEDVQNLVTDWYGELTEFTHPEKGSVLVRVDGNRRIRVFKDPMNTKVKVIFTDLNQREGEGRLAKES
ncbi:MAG: hypothetical protein AAF806_15615 [Bacteroidota bacterium]